MTHSLSTGPRRSRPCSRTHRRSAGWRVYTAAGCGTPTAAARTPRPPRPRTRPARRTRTARPRPRTRLISDAVINYVFALQLRESEKSRTCHTSLTGLPHTGPHLRTRRRNRYPRGRSTAPGPRPGRWCLGTAASASPGQGSRA